MLGTVIALAIFSALYVASLSGFTQLELRNDQLTLRYILPERTRALSFSEVVNVHEEPAYEGRWRLIVITDSSGTYESALSFGMEVHKAADFLRQQMVQPYSLP